jgi:hypothetical protein
VAGGPCAISSASEHGQLLLSDERLPAFQGVNTQLRLAHVDKETRRSVYRILGVIRRIQGRGMKHGYEPQITVNGQHFRLRWDAGFEKWKEIEA